MQVPAEFSKMQFLLTGNRFSGVNIIKTRLEFDLQPSQKVKGAMLTIVLSVEIDYIEIEDKIKYQHYTTSEIPDSVLGSNPFPLLKDFSLCLEDELLRRYHASGPYKMLELPEADKMNDEEMNKALTYII